MSSTVKPMKHRTGSKSGVVIALGLVAALGVSLFAQTVFAGWVIESETITPPISVPLKVDKEGKTVAGKPEPAPIKKYTMWLQDNKVRVDLANITMIVDVESDSQYLILHDKSQYAIMPRESQQQVEQNANAGEPAPKAKVKPTATGKSETINGYKTQAYEAVLPDRKVTFWVTNDGKDADQLRKAMLDAYSQVLAHSDGSIDMKSLPGYPIKSVIETNPQKTTLKSGMVIATPGKKTTHTVTSIKAEQIDTDKFKVPTGYEATSMLPRFEPKPVENAKPAAATK